MPFVKQTIERKLQKFYEHCQLAVSLHIICLQKTGGKHDVEVFLGTRNITV
jgi:hypothetical protein